MRGAIVVAMLLLIASTRCRGERNGFETLDHPIIGAWQDPTRPEAGVIYFHHQSRRIDDCALGIFPADAVGWDIHDAGWLTVTIQAPRTGGEARAGRCRPDDAGGYDSPVISAFDFDEAHENLTLQIIDPPSEAHLERVEYLVLRDAGAD